jgi:hypothetical protein
MMKSLTGQRRCAAVDKPDPQPYLCAIASMTRAFILLTFLAVEPRIACFPLIWRMLPVPDGGAPRHGELMGNAEDPVRAATLLAFED